MEVAQVVQDAVIGLVREALPAVEDVFGDWTDRNREEQKENRTISDPDREWVYVDTAVSNCTQVSPDQIEIGLLVSVDYYHPDKKKRLYRVVSETLSRAFCPVLPFDYGGESRKITVRSIGSAVIGGVLHITFPLQFVFERPEEENYELMGELEHRLKEE